MQWLAGRYEDYLHSGAAACRGEAELPVSGEDGLGTVAVVDAARRSREIGRTELVGKAPSIPVSTS